MIKRKNYFVKKKFQSDFFIKFALLVVLEGALIAALFSYISRGTLTAAYKGSEFVIERTSAFFFADFIVMTFIVGFVIAVAAGAVFMYLSHRIGGALFRFEKTIDDARGGDFSQRVSLRKTDELFDMKDKFNIFLESMDSRLTGIKHDAERALEFIEDAKSQDSAKRAKDAVKGIKDALTFFKTSK